MRRASFAQLAVVVFGLLAASSASAQGWGAQPQQQPVPPPGWGAQPQQQPQQQPVPPQQAQWPDQSQQGTWGAQPPDASAQQTPAPGPAPTQPPPPAVEAPPADTNEALAPPELAFLLAARLPVTWVVAADTDLMLLPTALPRFVLGVQLGKLGLGVGLNFLSATSSSEGEDFSQTMLLLGPTASYQLIASAGGRVQLHGLATFVFGTGGQEETFEGDTQKIDHSALGFNAGVLGRAMVLDRFGIDAGVTFDILSLTQGAEGDDTTVTLLHLVGFLGVSFLI